MVFLCFLTACTTKGVNGGNENDTSIDDSFWADEYAFNEVLEGQSHIGKSYVLNIYQKDEKYWADISIDGWQTLRRLKAHVEGDNDSIQLIFDSYLPDNDFELFSTGDVLLTLTKRESKIITKWGEIKPIVRENEKDGVYFNKI